MPPRIGSETSEEGFREFDLSYYYKVMGVNVSGPKSVSEHFYTHPDGKTLFVFISYPKIGILKTSDNGRSYISQFFRLKLLDRIFGYTTTDEEESNVKDNISEEQQLRYFSHFAVSNHNPADVIITLGPYVFFSRDYGQKWKVKNIFIDYERSNIKDVFVTKRDEVVIFTENKMAVSKDWCNKWETRALKINDIGFFKTNYITGLYDNSTDTIYSVIQNTDETDSVLSKYTHDLFYKNIASPARTGVYYSTDFGKTWNETAVKVPIALWKTDNSIYGCPIYSMSFYNKKFDESFTGTPIYTTGKLDKSTYNVNDYLSILLQSETEDFEILSTKNNRIMKIDRDKYEIISENNFEKLYNGIKVLEKIDYVQWQPDWYSRARTANFNYEYNPYRMFKLWTGMRTDMPVKYVKNNGIYYRIKPSKKFTDVFFKYAVDNQTRINSIHPFLRKNSDIAFFNPAIDPTNGFPASIEYSKDGGTNWEELVNQEHARNIVDPLGNKRSAFYWYKNVDQKKNFKLQISFGFGQGINYMTYPADLEIYNNRLLIQMDYFSLMKSYKDAYIVPLNAK